MKTIVAADLFAGAGGTSVALKQACEQLGRKVQLTAVNHWPVAVETHAANHPEAKHLCETLDSVDPRKAVPGGKLDVLCASRSASTTPTPAGASRATTRAGRPPGTWSGGPTPSARGPSWSRTSASSPTGAR
jgi:hypothetical protein